RLGAVHVGAAGRVAADLGTAAPGPSAGVNDPPAADMESALRLATALLPRESAGRIAVVGNGVETRGSIAAALPEILARGIPIDVHLNPDASRDVAVEALSVPDAVHPNERYRLRAAIGASAATT